jgi:hypothetical protein
MNLLVVIAKAKGYWATEDCQYQEDRNRPRRRANPAVRLLVNLRHICTLHVITTTGASPVWAETSQRMWKLSAMKESQSELRAIFLHFRGTMLLPFILLSRVLSYFNLTSSYFPSLLPFSDLFPSYINSFFISPLFLTAFRLSFFLIFSTSFSLSV